MKKPIDIQFIKFPKAEFIIGSFEDKLCLCDFKYRKARRAIDKRLQLGLSGYFIEQSNNLLNKTKNALEEYFSGDRDNFNLPLLTVGTIFQKSVWNSLLEIPYGETISYETLAANVGNRNAVRAVGSANGANALAIIIPCHRVISASGSLGGYSGGLSLKQDLLNLENGAQ